MCSTMWHYLVCFPLWCCRFAAQNKEGCHSGPEPRMPVGHHSLLSSRLWTLRPLLAARVTWRNTLLLIFEDRIQTPKPQFNVGSLDFFLSFLRVWAGLFRRKQINFHPLPDCGCHSCHICTFLLLLFCVCAKPGLLKYIPIKLNCYAEAYFIPMALGCHKCVS